MFSSIGHLLSIPAKTDTDTLLDQMEKLLKDYEKFMLQNYKGEVLVVILKANTGVGLLYVKNIHSRFTALMKLYSQFSFSAEQKKRYTAIVENYKSHRACFTLPFSGDSDSDSLSDPLLLT